MVSMGNPVSRVEENRNSKLAAICGKHKRKIKESERKAYDRVFFHEDEFLFFQRLKKRKIDVTNASR